jgi:MFS family permease
LRALRNANYRRYFAGQTVSMTGTWMQAMVQSWLVYRLSHSGAWLGAIAICQQVPAFFMSPLAGVIADHADRRKALIWVEAVSMLQAFLLTALVVSGRVELWHVAALSVVLGLASAFDMTLRHSLTVDLVGKQDLISAISLNSIIINGSRILGPSLAGVLIVTIGEAGCFFVNGVSYFATILTLLPMRMAHAPSAEERARAPFRRERLLAEIREAAAYAWKTRAIRGLLLVSMLISLIAAPYTQLLPVFAKVVLGGNEGTLATLSAIAGLGGVSGVLVLSSRLARQTGPRLPRALALCLVLLGASLAGLGASHSLLPSSLSLFGLAFFLMGIFPAINNSIQQQVHDRLRGRVLSLYTMTFLGTAPIGALGLGWACDRLGPEATTVAAGLLLAAAGAAYLFSRAQRAQTQRETSAAATPPLQSGS